MSKLVMEAVGQFFTRPQWGSRNTGTLGVAPDEFVGIRLRCVTGQEMQRQVGLSLVQGQPQ